MKRDWGPIIGAAQLAIGRPAGMARFGDSPQAFLASLAPLIAFPLVGAVFLLLKVGAVRAATTFLLTLVAQLAPAVLSHAMAVRWDREAAWLRYATAFNWCQWAIPIAAFVVLLLLQLADGGGLSDEAASDLLLVVLAGYGIFLHWMLARYGLSLRAGRAMLLVLLVNAGTVALVLGPRWLAASLGS